MNPHIERFDEQATTFERRAGLDEATGQTVAQAICATFSLGVDDVLLEIGAGTGSIGRHVAALPIGYVGMDLSAAMLSVFARNRQEPAGRMLLLQADGNAAWPIRNRSVSVVFASRAAHLFDAAHLLDELTRTCRPRGYLGIGRVKRDGDSVKSRLRRRKRALLAANGFERPGGLERNDALVASCVARGASPLDTATVARWTAQTTPEQVIADWEARSDVGGFRLPADLRNALFADLRSWAAAEFGALDTPESSVERYTIGGVRLP